MANGKTLIGYTDRLSVTSGDRQQFMISSAGPFDATLVRIVCAEAGPRYAEQAVSSSLAGTYGGGVQPIRCGSWGRTAPMPAFRDYTVSLYFMPTRLTREAAALLDAPLGSLTMVVGEGGLQVLGRDGRALVDRIPVTTGRWHWLALSVAGERIDLSVICRARNVGESPLHLFATADRGDALSIPAGAWLLGACEPASTGLARFFNGRLELPWIAHEPIDGAEALRLTESMERLATDPRIAAAWDFSRDISSDRFVDISAHRRDGSFFNTPTRALAGCKWDGSEQDWKRAPLHYGAVHFHDDDLTDADWRAGLAWVVPENLPSGVYAVKLTSNEQEDYVPFVVRPSPRRTMAKVAFLLPTATYLAYANTRFSMYAALLGLTTMSEVDAYLHAHPEVGLSLYERHSDGSGVHYSSYRRPVANMKPKGKLWAFTADMNIAAWLHHLQLPFDTITDEDLHREGADILEGYAALITGTHPEYASTRMLDALEAYVSGGGRLMYLGGNGFYWRIAYHPNRPDLIELRRAEGRGRAWDSDPGEYYHSFTGEYGGLWRLLGRSPNRLTGVGFVALAHEGSTGYRRQAGARDPRAAFIFAGTSEGDSFGAYGSVCGGAVSQEIDRANVLLGSPAHTLVLASSENHPPDFMLGREEADAIYPDEQGPKLRADMTFFETPAGGAVFSVGSIGFAGALAHNGYANDIARIAANVLTRFLDPAVFACPSNEGPAGANASRG